MEGRRLSFEIGGIAAAFALALLAAGCGGGGGSAFGDGLPAAVAAGEGGVWVATDRVEMFRLDPESEEVTEVAPANGGDVAVGEGAVWTFGASVSGQAATIFRVDPKTSKASELAVVPSHSNALAAGEGAVWVASDDGLQRIDTATGDVRTIFVPNDYAANVAVGEGAVWALASAISAERDVVAKVDPATKKVVDEIEIGAPDYADTSIAAGAGAVWVVQSFDTDVAENEARDPGVVYRIDPQTGDVEETAEVGEGEHEIAAGDEGVWETNSDGNQVFRLDPESGEVFDTFEPGDAPHSIAVGFGAAWVATGTYVETGETTTVPGGGEAGLLEPEDADVVRIEP
jgi:hypothetical protein